MRHDLLSDAMSAIMNAAKIGKREVVVVNSKLVKAVLMVFQKAGYITFVNSMGNEIHVTLSGKINTIKAVRPRFAVSFDEFEKFETRYLPSRELGVIVVSTSEGVISHKEAKERKIGGRILAYAY